MILIIPHAPMLSFATIARASRSLRIFSAIMNIVTDDTVQHRVNRASEASGNDNHFQLAAYLLRVLQNVKTTCILL